IGRETSAIFTESKACPIPGTSRPNRRPMAIAAMIHTGRNRSSVDSFAGTGSAASTVTGMLIELLDQSTFAGGCQTARIDGCRDESNHLVSTTVNMWAQ